MSAEHWKQVVADLSNREVLCAIDVGSNSVKVRVLEMSGRAPRVLFENRYPIRLGASVFTRGELARQDIECTVGAFEEIRAICRAHEVSRVRAVATSALREAVNRDELVDAVRKAAGFQIEVISGAEEARLLALAVRPDMQRGRRNLVIDVGGGSTEWVYTREDLEIDAMHSLRLGAVRLNQSISPDYPLSKRDFGLLEAAVRNYLEQEHLPVIARNTHVIGVAGTMRAILQVQNVSIGREFHHFTRQELGKSLRALREMPLDQMEQRFGLDRRRAQIMIPGALIVAGVMELYDIHEIAVSARGVRDGLFDDMLQPGAHRPALDPYSFALQAGQKYQFEQSHGEHVAWLALRIFDQMKELHGLRDPCREALRYAGLLHDIGRFVGYSRHHKHGWYLVLNEELPGITGVQQRLAASIVRYHRKSFPSERHPEFQQLAPDERDAVVKCAAIVRVADALDREHRQLVKDVEVSITRQSIRLRLQAAEPVFLELSALRRKRQLFEKVFGRTLEVEGEERNMPADTANGASHEQDE